MYRAILKGFVVKIEEAERKKKKIEAISRFFCFRTRLFIKYLVDRSLRALSSFPSFSTLR